MSLLTQSLAVSRLSLASLRQRGWSALVIVVGTACTIGVLLAMLSVTAGLLRAARAGGDPLNVIILSKESSGEFGGGISRTDVDTILSAPGIAQGDDGKPIGAAQVVRQLPPAAGFADGSLEMRGIGAGGLRCTEAFTSSRAGCSGRACTNSSSVREPTGNSASRSATG